MKRSTQKFPIDSKVKVNVSKDKVWMSHFDSGFTGIVRGTYHQLYGGGDRKSYSIYMLNKKETEIINCISWYDKDDLTLVKGWDRNIGRDMAEEYESEN